MKICFFFFILFGTLALVAGQRCQKYDSRLPHCDWILDGSDVFTIPEYGVTQEYLQALMFAKQPPFNISIFDPLPILQANCAKAYLRLWCPSMLRPCTTMGEYAVPQPPCRSQCEELNEICAPDLAALGFPPFDCDQPDPLLGNGPLWPRVEDNPMCMVWNLEELSHPKYPCPYPLTNIGPEVDELTGLPCSATCAKKLRLISGDDGDVFDEVFLMSQICSWIALPCVLYIGVTYFTFPATRAFPFRAVGMVAISYIFVLTPLLGNSVQKTNDFLCDGEFHMKTSGYARFSAWSLWFGALAAAGWWAVQALIIFWNVGLKRRPDDLAKYEPYMHVFVWGTALLFTFVPFGLEEEGFGATPSIPWAFGSYAMNNKYNWGFFYSLWILYLLIAAIGLASAMFRIFMEGSLKQTRVKRAFFQIQLAFFVFTFLFLGISIVGSKTYIDLHSDELNGSIGGWYACVFFGGGDSCESSFVVPRFWTFFLGFMITLPIPVAMLICFGLLHERNRRLWPMAFKNWRNGVPIFESIKFASSGRTTTRGSGSSSKTGTRSNGSTTSSATASGSATPRGEVDHHSDSV